MKKQIPADLLNKYLKGQCTTGEEAFINKWYDSHERDFDHISSISDAQKQVLKSRIRSRIAANVDTAYQPGNYNFRNKVRAIIYALSGTAASILVIFLLLQNHKTRIINNGPGILVITNNTPNIYEQVLSDGSHVWLNPGAQIRYPKAFSGNKREVRMSGESFFEVTKNPAKPFIIYSGNLVTKVWGTSFRVRDDKNLPYADVTVVTGKVSVRLTHAGALHVAKTASYNANEEVMIYPDQNVTYTKGTSVFKEIPKADMKELRIWKKINVAFDNKQMSEVLPVLEKQFDVNITAANDKIKAYLLNADFNDLNLPQVLELLHKTLNVSYEIKGRDITLK